MDIRNDKQEGEKWIREAAERAGQAGAVEEGKRGSSAAAHAGHEARAISEKEKKPSGLSFLNKEPRDVSVILPGDETEEPKKKKKKSSKKKASNNVDEIETLVNGLLTSVFAIAATKDPDVWTVTPQEVDSISEPAGKILAKMDKAGKVGEYADGLSLLLAVLLVIGSRVVKSAKKKKGGVKLERTGKHEGTRANDNRTNNSSPEPSPNAQHPFADVLPAVG